MSHKLNFFDLDGTLTDRLQYALQRLGQVCPDKIELTKYIGRPLRSTFEHLLHTKDKNRIEQAVWLFRERFSSIGLFENSLYEGIPKLLFS